MKIQIGAITRIINRAGEIVGSGKVLSIDPKKHYYSFLVEWIGHEEKKCQQEEVAYWRLLDISCR